MEGGSIIDFEPTAVKGLIRRAVEVKGWTSQAWRRALEAWEASKNAATKLDAKQKKLLEQLRTVSKQLKDATRETEESAQPPNESPVPPTLSEIKGERSPERILAALGIPPEWFQQ